MKKLITVFIIAAMLLLAVACTGGNAAPQGDFTKADMGIKIGDTTYSIRTDSAPLIEALGPDYEYSYVVSCVYDGDDKTYEYDGIVVSTVPVDGKDIIEMITITSANYTTLRGITVGATLDDIVAAYGDKYFDDGYITYTYDNDPENYNTERLQFELDDSGKVATIYIYSPSY